MSSEPVLLPSLLLSDHIIREEGTGKLSLIGCFQSFTSAKFPLVLKPFIVTAMVTNIAPDAKGVHVTIRFEEPKSGHVFGSSSVEVQFTQPIVRKAVVEIPVTLGPLQISSPSTYRLVALVNNEQVGTREVDVIGLPGNTNVV